MADKSETLELYKTYVDTVSNNEAKRIQSNATYSAFLAAVATAGMAIRDVESTFFFVVGLIVSLIWFFTIKYHRDLASAKFKVIKELECQFDFKPFELEWKHYKAKRWAFSLTYLELSVPAVAIVICTTWLTVKTILFFYQPS